MTFLIAQGQSHVLKFNLLFQLNITEAKLFFDLTGFEPRTSGSEDLVIIIIFYMLIMTFLMVQGQRSPCRMKVHIRVSI